MVKKTTWQGLNPGKDYSKYAGFVYRITELKTGLIYIGIKKFWTKKKRETNWKTYVSSSGKLKELDINNKKLFKKEIIKLCDTITDMKVTEAWIQLDYYMRGEWNKLYNEMIHLRVRIRKENDKKN